MAKKKKKPMAKKPMKSTKSKRLKNQSRFSSGQLLAFALIFAVVGGLVIWRSLAAPPSKSAYLTTLNPVFKELQNPVEQESPNFFYCGGSIGPIKCPFDKSTWVNNPTDCAWDVDDGIEFSAYGSIKAGSGITSGGCLINDGLASFGHRHAEATLNASTPNLKLTLTNDHGFAQTATPVQVSKNSYHYVLCMYDNTPGPYPTIPDSNNGYGTMVNYTFSLSDPTSHSYNGLAIQFVLGRTRTLDTGCTVWQPTQ